QCVAELSSRRGFGIDARCSGLLEVSRQHLLMKSHLLGELPLERPSAHTRGQSIPEMKHAITPTRDEGHGQVSCARMTREMAFIERVNADSSMPSCVLPAAVRR